MTLEIGIGATSAAKLFSVSPIVVAISVHLGMPFKHAEVEETVGEETFEYKVQLFRLGLGVDANKVSRELSAAALRGWRVVRTDVCADVASMHGSVYVVMMERAVAAEA